MTALEDSELLRYSRHFLLPQWQPDSQDRLSQAVVLLIGVGGLGSAAALYLAAAGVGTLYLVDHDQVELSNLQRQVIHSTDSIGGSKAESAACRLQALNPGVRLLPVSQRVDAEFLSTLETMPDLVLDGSDNFLTRYAVNAFCVGQGIPLVSGAAIGWTGQLGVFDSRLSGTPCYQCIYPAKESTEESTEEAEDSCFRSGVIGPLVGVIGSMMALEGIKVLTRLESPLISRFLVYDSARSEFRTLKTRQDPQCPVCAARQAARKAGPL